MDGNMHTRRYLVDPPRDSGFDQRHFDLQVHAEEYAERCPAHTRIVDRMPEQTPETSPNPPNPKQRYGDLKVPLGLVPSSAKIYMALALAEGAAKYGFFNWRDKAVEAMTYIHALERHVSAWVDGEDTDPTSGKPHLGHAMACLAILADATEVGNLIDNRPLSAPTGELLEEFAADKLDDDETPVGCSERAHAWIVADCPSCNPVPEKPACHHHRLTQRCAVCDPKPTPKWDAMNPTRCVDFGAGDDHEPKWEGMMKWACQCERGRCKVENGWTLGLQVYCCQAEEGR